MTVAPAFKLKMGPKRPYILTQVGHGILVEPLQHIPLTELHHQPAPRRDDDGGEGSAAGGSVHNGDKL
jgi:hypothetical protein